eukprot:10696753-Lingulodinium_polyedra.AAC.1
MVFQRKAGTRNTLPLRRPSERRGPETRPPARDPELTQRINYGRRKRPAGEARAGPDNWRGPTQRNNPR